MDPQGDIESRLARFVRSRHGRDLWPDVSATAFRAAQREVARVTAAVLAGRPASLDVSPGVTAAALNAAAFAGGVGPLLAYWHETGRLTAHPDAAQRFHTALDHARRRGARMGTALAEVSALLAGRGVEVCLVKSTDTRYRYFPDPGARTSADIDLLVQQGDRQIVGSLLQQAGFRARADRWSPPGQGGVPRSLDFSHVDDPWTLHLHWALDQPGTAASRATLGTPDPAACGQWRGLGVPLLVLPSALLLAHLALHTSAHLGAIMLVRLVELVFVMRRDFAGRPDAWRTFADLVAETGTHGLVFAGLELAERLAPGTVDAEVRARLAAAAPGRVRRTVRAMTPATALRMHPLPGGA